jgi:hypothetical protein
MKKGLCVVGFLVLAAQVPLWGYDSSPSVVKIIPEAIWAAAMGGGTWVTEIQISCCGTGSSDVSVFFDHKDGSQGPVLLYSGLLWGNSLRYANILATIDSLDPAAFDYYGRVGALYFQSGGGHGLIQVQAKTVNANYGKTFPGLSIVAGDTAAIGRKMMILDLARNATYRTAIGAYNPVAGVTYSVTFMIIGPYDNLIGSAFSKTLGPFGFISFNPFNEAAAPPGNYENCWLHIEVTSGATASADDGVVCFGSIGNNSTNDTYALIAMQYGSGSGALPPQFRY